MSEQANKDCIFCKIISKEVPAKIIAENDDVLVIEDLHPKAPVHYLIIPKKHIVNVKDLEEADITYISHVMRMARDLSKKLPGDGAFRLLINNGKGAGQSVFHMHFHFLSGKKMSDF